MLNKNFDEININTKKKPHNFITKNKEHKSSAKSFFPSLMITSISEYSKYIGTEATGSKVSPS